MFLLNLWLRIFLLFSAFALSSGAAESFESGRVLRGTEALGDYRTDSPGVRRLITVKDMSEPDTKKSADKGPHIVPRPAGALPRVPQGFVVELLAANLNNPGKITTAPDGDIFVAESTPGRVTILRQNTSNGNGAA